MYLCGTCSFDFRCHEASSLLEKKCLISMRFFTCINKGPTFAQVPAEMGTYWSETDPQRSLGCAWRELMQTCGTFNLHTLTLGWIQQRALMGCSILPKDTSPCRLEG